MIPTALIAAAVALITATIAARLTGRIEMRTLNGLMAIANTTVLIVNVIRHDTVYASVAAAVAALSMWLWWKGGGGDDAKRRLRSWGRKFRGVRRTAPAGGTA